MDNLRVLILAAGKSTRMKSKYAKVLHRAGGRTLIEQVLGVARKVSNNIFVVVGHSADQVKAAISEVTFIDQTEQLGTGHAVSAARENFSDYSGDVLVMPGDVPLIGAATLEAFVRFHREGGFCASVLTADIENPSGYGRIVRSAGSDGKGLHSIVEHRDAPADILKIREINSGIYVFNSKHLFESLTRIRNDNAQREYYLTDVIGILTAHGQKVGAFKVQAPEEVLGINTRQELAAVDRVMRRRKCDSLMSDGVTIVDPATVYIDAEVEIGPDTTIYPSVQIYGRTVIGEDASIHSFSRISNSRIGARSVVLEGCVVNDSTVGENVSIGPYAHLRMGTALGDSAKVGNFVEIKKSVLGPGTKSMHLAYLGDATIGKNVNIGAGVITCNYDGVKKHSTVIEDGAFVGTDSQLIAPVRIGKDAYVAAGSSITEDVPTESLAVARGRQINKEGWVSKRKKS
jgi:bifunctional UDP-N-acetylglucosamine pyrophosphorylase/glucosamine-1-phosphate N-acetyltransferase